MLFPKESTDLVKNSPFKQFVLMELERERLYHFYSSIDEFQEINKNWKEFSNFCAYSLYNVSNLASMLYQRYLDEFIRDEEKISDDHDRKEHLINQIENLQEFQMETAILMTIYANVVNKGIFSSTKSKDYSPYYMEGYRILNRISSTYFDSSHPQANTIEDIMLAFSFLNQKRHLLQIIEQAPESEKGKKFYLENGFFELNLAEFDGIFKSRLLLQLSEEWWWNDPIALHFVFDRQEYHFQEAIKHFVKVPEDPERNAVQIQERFLPVNKTWKNSALVGHYYRLGLEATKQENYSASREYFNLILGLIDEMKENLKDIPESKIKFFTFIQDTIKNKTTYQTLKELSNITIKARDLIEKYTLEPPIDEINKLISEIETEVNNPQLLTGINYVSSLPFIYKNFIRDMQIGILSDKNKKETLKEALDNFNKLAERLKFALNDIVQEIEGIENNPKNFSEERYKNLINDIKKIKLTTFYIPSCDNKVDLIQEIESIQYLAEASYIYYTTKQQEINEILLLIYHSKSHYFSTKALEAAQKSTMTIIPRKLLNKRYSQTFIDGQQSELRLFELARQFLFLNSVIDWLAKAYTLSLSSKEFKDLNYKDLLNNCFSQFELFETINTRIIESCNELINHKELFHTDNIQINWKAIEMKRILSEVLEGFLNTTKETILGYGARSSKEQYKATSHFESSYKILTKTTEILKPVAHMDSNITQLSNQLYEFSMLIKELERGTRERDKIQNLPLSQILELMKKLAFLS